ncbi:MAG: YggS family pyridoxal phosphate-dependent enzyme [Candidatus Kariarchaeaceae archaeon]
MKQKMQEERPDPSKSKEEKQLVHAIKGKYQRIAQGIVISLKKAKRKDQVKLIAVSKKKEVALIQEAISLGIDSFGENYLQEAEEKKEAFGSKELHFIGKLQTSKMNRIIKLFDWVQTIENKEQLETLNKKAEQLQKKIYALLQINIGKEETKQGWTTENFKQTIEGLAEIQRQNSMIEIKGLMTIPPYNVTEEQLRKYYTTMRSLGEKMGKELRLEKVELSFGMSGDYEVAIEEGATMVRLGTALFGSRE